MGNVINNLYYIVADECHYFFSDSAFNATTNLSYQFILNMYGLCRIFISATMERFMQYIENDFKYIKSLSVFNSVTACMNPRQIYECQADYSYINFQYFCENTEIIELIEKFKKEKWVIFVDSKKNGIEINETLKNKEISSMFVDAEYSAEFSEDEVNQIVKSKKSSYQVLIATSVLDCGISLVDNDLKNMIILADTKESFMQMLGRKRKENDEEVLNLYVKKRTKGDFVRRLNVYQERMKILNELNWQQPKECNVILEEILKNERLYDCIRNISYVYQGKLQFNIFGCLQIYHLCNHYTSIIERFDREGESAFLYEQAEWLGLENIDEILEEDDKKRYDAYLRKVTELIDGYFIEKESNENKERVIFTEKENKKFKIELFEIIKQLPVSEVNAPQDKWKLVLSDVQKKDRVLAPKRFNNDLMKILSLNYEMSQTKIGDEEKEYVIIKK